MKKKTLISLIGISLLLVGCDYVKKVVVNSPKFENFGEEISLGIFTTAFEEQHAKCDIQLEASLDSKWININEASLLKQAVTRSENKSSNSAKKIRETIYGNKEKDVIKYDSSKSIVLENKETYEVSTVFNETTNTSEGKEEKTEAGVANVGYQNEKVHISFDNAKDTFSIEKTFSDVEDPKQFIDLRVKGICYEIMLTPFTNLIPDSELSSEELDRFSFYKNDDIFTIQYSNVTDTELKDENDVLINMSSVKSSFTAQLKIGEHEQFYKYYRNDSVYVSYFQNTTTYHAGEVSQFTFTASSDISAKSKRVSLKNINLSNYDLVE